MSLWWNSEHYPAYLEARRNLDVVVFWPIVWWLLRQATRVVMWLIRRLGAQHLM